MALVAEICIAVVVTPIYVYPFVPFWRAEKNVTVRSLSAASVCVEEFSDLLALAFVLLFSLTQLLERTIVLSF